MATEEEIEAYLALTGDDEAKRFIGAFWERRKPDPDSFLNEALETYERRVKEADRLYREAGQRGRRTDRGAIYVLYGPPEDTEFESSPRPGLGPVEVWKYPKNAPKGLDGKRPRVRYGFVKRGDLTVEYNLSTPRRRSATLHSGGG